MAQQTINIGSAANDGTGDPLRTAFDKVNDNFTELYGVTAPGTGNNVAISGNSIISENSNGNIVLDPNGTGNVVIATGAELVITDRTDHAIPYTEETTGELSFTSKLTYNAGTGTFTAEDITINAATISSANSNQNITLDPVGSGVVSISSNLEVTGTITSNGPITSSTGASSVVNLTVDSLNLNNNKISTNTSNADIELDPNGTGTVNFIVPTQSTVGSAGAGNALPATPSGYLNVKINNTDYVIPYYAAS